MSNRSDCISVDDLSYKYNSYFAVDGISFKVKYGEIFGFLGPNGAGKTTTIKILTTLLQPSLGSVKIFDKDITKYSSEIRNRIGVVLQQPSLEPNLTVERSLDIYGRIWKIPEEIRRNKIKEIIERFELESIRKTKNIELSTGQIRRVQVAREFIHDMDLLFLDEPTVGLDPEARRMLLDYVKSLSKSGMTIFFTTHILEEAEYLCDRIAIINKAKIVAIDSPNELKNKYHGIKIIEIKTSGISYPSDLHFLEPLSGNQNIHIEKDILRIESVNAEQILLKAIESLLRKGVKIENISITPPSLEDAFLSIIHT